MQSAGAGPSTQRGPAAQPTTETIQQMLEENQRFIQAAMEHQNAGNLHAAAQYQQRLQQNLMLLSTFCDQRYGLCKALVKWPHWRLRHEVKEQ
ncbi:hypothetical protein WJX84_001230 [Apatococcus fuscideae]|uniref:SS18 N-terminal domain-containing protein n=1 Tax=Apatococcus fuscideae TaxID=2026836 RepID=A0AAW1T174_9CHLO